MLVTDEILQQSLAIEYSGRWVTFRLVVCGAEEHEATVLHGHEAPSHKERVSFGLHGNTRSLASLHPLVPIFGAAHILPLREKACFSIFKFHFKNLLCILKIFSKPERNHQ